MIALEGGEREQEAEEWEKSLRNVVALASVGATIGYRAGRQVLLLLQQDPIMIDSRAERIIRQVLHHILSAATPQEISHDTITIAQEYLELLQDMLQKTRSR